MKIRWRIRILFDRYRSLTSDIQTREKLQKGHKVRILSIDCSNISNLFLQLLQVFTSANAGNERNRLVLARYESMIKAKRDKERIKEIIRKELVSFICKPIVSSLY